MGKLFGTDGIRGLAGSFPLDQVTVSVIGSSLTSLLNETQGRRPRFIVGRDTRESGPAIEEAFCSGAIASGATCSSAGVITTPGVAFLTGHSGFDAGIVISASHNPYEDNGVKIFMPDGKKASRDIERRIESDVANGSSSEANSETTDTGEDKSPASFCREYVEHIWGSFKELNLSGKTLVIDCAHGAASAIAPGLFARTGANVIAINDRPDGRNINRDCGSLHLEGLEAKVLENSADAGIAFDGDADRALFVDEKGEIVDGDATMWALAGHLLDHGRLQNRTVVATVMSNIGLELAFQTRGVKLLRTAVGDKYVLEELLASGSEIGGEQSGHIIFPERSLVGDGMVTALMMLETMNERRVRFSELADGFTAFPQILLNVRVREKRPFEEVSEILRESTAVENELHGSGRLLLRYSGTENLARVMIEGPDHATISEQARRLATVIERALS
jgi:phosphoglucosamine mutase